MPELKIDPFRGPSPDDVALPDGPLEKVLAQVQFPPILRLEQEEAIVSVQEALRRDFPRFDRRVDTNVSLQFGDTSPSVVREDRKLWRFETLDRTTGVTLGRTAVTLDTSRYEGRVAFLDRLAMVVAALRENVEPAIATRVSLRYINRLDATDAERNAHRMPEFAVGLSAGPYSDILVHGMTDAQIIVPEGELSFRWGVLPPHTTFDPNVAPWDRRSWILDIDVASSQERAFEANDLRETFEGLAARSYAVFRGMIGDALIAEATDA